MYWMLVYLVFERFVQVDRLILQTIQNVYSSLTFISRNKTSVLALQRALFIHFHISRPSCHHSPPDWCDSVCVPVTRDEQLTEGGGSELWKRHRSGLPLALNEHSAQWIRIRARRRMFVDLFRRLWAHLAVFLPSHVEQRTQTEAEGAVCHCIPQGFGFII